MNEAPQNLPSPENKNEIQSPQGATEQSIVEHQKRSGFEAFFSVAFFVIGVILAALFINQFVFQSYYVDGTSMTPTLHNNDRLIIDKVEKSLANLGSKTYLPKRGQIVVLDSSLVDGYGRNEQLIKRVVGLPGDDVIIENGSVTIKNAQSPNGFDYNKAEHLNLAQTYSDQPINVIVPANQIFVMGDNRVAGGSYDSRSFGTIPADKIQGRLLARIFPLNQIRLF